MSTRSRRATLGAIAALSFLATTLSTGRAEMPERSERPRFAFVSIAAPTVELAGRCDLHATIATVTIRAQNRAFTPSLPKTIRVLDSAHALAGTAGLPQLGAHESRSIDVPLSLGTTLDPVPATGPAAIAGTHTFRVYLTDSAPGHSRPVTSVADVSSTIPAAFCAAAIALAAPTAPASHVPGATQNLTATRAQVLFGGAAPVGPSTNAKARTLPYAFATPSLPDSIAATRKTPVTLIVGVPQNLRAASSVDDCKLHALTSASCASVMSSGDVVLVWDAPGDASVDGYRLYALKGVERGPATATFTGRLQTLANLPPVTSGFAKQCYVVTATRGSSESAAGPAFCAHQATSTQTLVTTYARGVWEDHAAHGGLSGTVPGDNVPDGAVVGYYHAKNASAAGDARYTKIHRYAVAFDMDALRNKRLVSARLHLTIRSSYGAGNNRSCATTVASGIEFWWKSDAQQWIEGSFDGTAVPLNTTGPVVTADVTRLVAAIAAGSPNYGFVVRNDDENLGAFVNAQCETVYANPQLELVYYN